MSRLGESARQQRRQGFAADPDYWKGEVFAYVGLPQNLKDLKDAGHVACQLDTIQGYLAHNKHPPS